MRSIDSIDKQLLMDAIYWKHGFDFRDYAEASLRRRIDAIQAKFRIDDPLDLLKRVVREKEFFDSVLPMLTVTTSEFFRDPAFFRALRDEVLPVLKTYPTFNLWVAGCSTGEEVYSLAILLTEAGLKDRATIFATDINPVALKCAREGIYDLQAMRIFTKNYAEAGGARSPSDYYTADYGLARLNPALRDNVVFSEHNLVTDRDFTECNLILCRNVLIYFSRELQDRVLNLFKDSLGHRGFLGLGSKEAIRFSTVHASFEEVDGHQKIFRKSSEASARADRFHSEKKP